MNSIILEGIGYYVVYIGLALVVLEGGYRYALRFLGNVRQGKG